MTCRLGGGVMTGYIPKTLQEQIPCSPYCEGAFHAKGETPHPSCIRTEVARLEKDLAKTNRAMQAAIDAGTVALAENIALKRLITDEFDFGAGEIRHYLKHALLTADEQENDNPYGLIDWRKLVEGE